MDVEVEGEGGISSGSDTIPTVSTTWLAYMIASRVPYYEYKRFAIFTFTYGMTKLASPILSSRPRTISHPNTFLRLHKSRKRRQNKRTSH